MKTKKAAAKRFRFTAGGKVKMNHEGRRHKLGHKTTKRKRQLRRSGYVSVSRHDDIKRMLPYG